MPTARYECVRLLCIALLLIGWTALPAATASRCKGLSQGQCENADACTWVAGYTTKSGTKVSAYCRVKSRKGGASSKGKGGASGTARSETGKSGPNSH